jgi:hypothetical protein
LCGYTTDFFERPLGKPKGESKPQVGSSRPNKLEQEENQDEEGGF